MDDTEKVEKIAGDSKPLNKTGEAQPDMLRKGGYTPQFHGYTPDQSIEAGYAPHVVFDLLPQPPTGGTGVIASPGADQQPQVKVAEGQAGKDLGKKE